MNKSFIPLHVFSNICKIYPPFIEVAMSSFRYLTFPIARAKDNIVATLIADCLLQSCLPPSCLWPCLLRIQRLLLFQVLQTHYYYIKTNTHRNAPLQESYSRRRLACLLFINKFTTFTDIVL
jgi:hypothetical protein